MEIAPETASSTTAANPRWIRAVRVLTLASLPFIAEPFVLIVINERTEGLFSLLLLSPLWLGYLGIALLLQGRKQAETLKTAVTIGPPAVVIGLAAGLFIKFSPDWYWVRACFSLFAGSQLPLVVTAFGAFYSIPEDSRQGRIPLWSLVYGLLFVMLMVLIGAIVVPGWLSSRYHSDQASLVYSLRSIHTAASTYQKTYGNGFPFHRGILTPPRTGTPAGCNAAGLIEPALARRHRSGYIIEYWPGPRVSTPPAGCVPGVQSFRITARPLEFGRTGTISYLSDEAGIVRQTIQDRSATLDDPPVEH
jgi:MFS family permease